MHKFKNIFIFDIHYTISMNNKKFMYAFGILLFMACGAQNADQKDTAYIRSDLPGRTQLFENFRQSKKLLIICGDRDTASYAFVKNVIDNMEHSRFDLEIEVKKIADVSDSDLVQYPLYFIGTASSFSFTKNENVLPVIFQDAKFEFDHQEYNDPGDIIKISFYPSPYNPQLPLTLISGNSADSIASFIRHSWNNRGHFLWDNWGYQVYHDGNRVVLGEFSDEAETAWQPDKKIHWNFDYDGKIVGENSVFQFIDHNSGLTKTYVDSIIQETDIDAKKLLSAAGKALPQKIKFHLYASTEVKGLMLDDNTQMSVDNTTNEVHAVLNNEFQGRRNCNYLIAVLRSLYGKPAFTALEYGIANTFSDKSVEQDVNIQNALRLYKAGTLPSLENLLDNNGYKNSSSYMMQAAASAFVAFLQQEYPQELFDRFNTFTKQQLLGYTPAFDAYMKMQSHEIKQGLAGNINPAYIKGFNFAHEGYQIYNGYGGSTAVLAIEKMKSLGTNSISIIPYTGTGDLTTPTEFEFSRGAGGENDEAVIHSIYTAKQNGMRVLLKPQIFCWQGWSGDINMQNENDWNKFFDCYTKWIMHYALLAEMYEADIFSVGVELQDATTSHPEAWKKLIAEVRQVYSGKITYCANWGYEFDNIHFWDDLDYMSVNCYYPLSEKNDPTDEELKTSFEATLDHLHSAQKKFNKPFLFTEIGFKSIERPWIKPHFDDDDQQVDQLAQKRCYEAIFSAMQDEDWISGMYIWQFPTYMDYAKRNTKGFTPCGKQAEAIVAKYYTQK